MPIPELPDVAGTWQAINDELEKQFEDLQGTIGASLKMGLEVKEEGLIADYRNAWEGAKEIAEAEGKSAGMVFVKAMWDSYSEKMEKLHEPFKRLL